MSTSSQTNPLSQLEKQIVVDNDSEEEEHEGDYEVKRTVKNSER